jgi:hypothetical protein
MEIGQGPNWGCNAKEKKENNNSNNNNNNSILLSVCQLQVEYNSRALKSIQN